MSSGVHVRVVTRDCNAVATLSNITCAGTDCGKLGRFSCRNCGAVKYCSIQCQKPAWPQHKKYCQAIQAQARQTAELAAELHACPLGWSAEPEDLFQTSVGHFWGMLHPRDYCRARRKLMSTLREYGHEGNSQLALKLALEHALDLIWLTRGDNQGLRHDVPHLQISLGRLREAYDFCKWWLNLDADYDPDDLELPYLDLRGEDVAEELDNLHIKEWGCTSLLLGVALVKVRK
eukprot:gene21627-26014_t